MDDCLSVCNLLKAAAGSCERELNESLAAFDVSHCQATILLKLADGTVSMSVLSREMCCHKSNITQVVAGLLRKDFIRRASLATDRRVSELRLTPKGKTVALRLKKILSSRAEECMKAFTLEEKRMFAGLLTKYIERHRA